MYARILAGVGEHSYDHGPDTPLEPMQIDGAVMYGKFFAMPGTRTWRIHLQIERPGVARPTEAAFAYERGSGS